MVIHFDLIRFVSIWFDSVSFIVVLLDAIRFVLIWLGFTCRVPLAWASDCFRVPGLTLLTPLPGLPLAPLAPLAPPANSKKLIFEYSFVNLTHFTVIDSNYFTRIFTPPV